jgi:hypothetical protein
MKTCVDWISLFPLFFSCLRLQVLPFVVDMIRNANDGFTALKFERITAERLATRKAHSQMDAAAASSASANGGKGKKFAMTGAGAGAAGSSGKIVKSSSSSTSSSSASSSASASSAASAQDEANGNGNGADDNDDSREPLEKRLQHVEDLATHAIAYLSAVITAHRDLCVPVFAAVFGSLSRMLVCASACV